MVGSRTLETPSHISVSGNSNLLMTDSSLSRKQMAIWDIPAFLLLWQKIFFVYCGLQLACIVQVKNEDEEGHSCHSKITADRSSFYQPRVTAGELPSLLYVVAEAVSSQSSWAQ
jgi:hypothetical protein